MPLPVLSRPPPITTTTPRGAGHRPFPSPRSIFPFPSLSSAPNPIPFLRLPSICAPSLPPPPPPPLPPPVGFEKPPPNPFRPPNSLPLLIVFAGLLSAWAFFHALPADFRERWCRLQESSKGAEAKILELPLHLIQAVIASEDRRFFYHIGVDPYGIGRAVVRYPKGGGGSTITQQLVKNVFLTSEQKISRKFFEGILSLLLERKMSKWEILYSYLSKMYWGHGNYGIESASLFYFRKHPSLLNLGESALLAGILPSPETFNPLTSPTRSKNSQAKVLRRMVTAGFLDLETALVAEFEHCRKHRGLSSINDIWDWEMASILHEARENMEKMGHRMYKYSH
ncbi:Transglycosylase [Musa troglodytarum]|uniref:Transglycosylase n=1 Tax=Musa troglodytarum TaxID=320322 RepID=A0A9E7GDG3_9LILI|nr:Transglycosylase [Musa troglodytarum]